MDRKAKIKEYKDNPRPMGVFQIINKVNGKILIGSLDDPRYDPADDLKFLEELWTEKLKPYGEKGYNK